MASILAFFRRLLRFLGLGAPEPAPHAASAQSPAPAKPAPAAPSPHPEVETRPDVQAPAPGPTTLAMPQLMATGGEYPPRGAGGTTANFTMAMVQTFAGLSPAFGAPRAEGQILQISNPMSDQALFALLGTNFGGNGVTTFGLPNLNSRVAIGGQQMGMMGQGTLTMTWMIATGASADAPLPGMLAMFASNWAPDGWAICDGSLLPITQNLPLFQAIGFAFGGNQINVFALPNLANGAAPVGVGEGPGRAPVTLGQQVAGPIAGVGVNYLIAVSGIFPQGSGGYFPQTGEYLGQVIAYGGAVPPPAWALCDGSLLQIADSETLFQVIGTTWGGDGEATFALPDLRGLMVTGLPG